MSILGLALVWLLPKAAMAGEVSSDAYQPIPQ
jgi:hypothetical protein